jgi:membrane protease YdiL (CAAX protease family)
MALPPPVAPPAGWYPSPWTPGGHAYWDGRQWYTPPAGSAPAEPHPTLPLVAAIGALVSVIVPLILVRYITEALVELEWPIVVYVALAAVLGYGPGLLWCWYVSQRWGSGHFRRDVGLQARWSDLGWGPVVYLCCLVAQITAGIVITLLGVPAEGNIGEIDEVDRAYVISILVLAVVAAPIAEEIIFRGVVMRGLRSVMGAVPTVAIQAVVFGAVHIDPVLGAGNIGLVIVLSAVGAVLGGAAYLFRRIVPSMIAHAILNSVALTLALTGVLDRLDG